MRGSCCWPIQWGPTKQHWQTVQSTIAAPDVREIERCQADVAQVWVVQRGSASGGSCLWRFQQGHMGLPWQTGQSMTAATLSG